jgi:hypothetical protein
MWLRLLLSFNPCSNIGKLLNQFQAYRLGGELAQQPATMLTLHFGPYASMLKEQCPDQHLNRPSRPDKEQIGHTSVVYPKLICLLLVAFIGESNTSPTRGLSTI